MSTAPWLRDDPAPNYRHLTLTQLLELWRSHRNDMVGAMAADEVCRRLCERRED